MPALNLLPLEAYEPNLGAWVRLFNEGQFRPSLDPLEAAWFDDRNRFLKGLIQLTVAMLQLATTDLDSGPRTLLIGARRLLRPFEPEHEGVDVAAARKMAARGLRRLARRRHATPGGSAVVESSGIEP
jgi:hypothetical protein